MKVWNELGELLTTGTAPAVTVNNTQYTETKVNIECPEDGNSYTVCVKLSAGKPALYLNAAGTSRLKDGRRQIRCDDDDLYYTLGVKYSAGKPTFYLVTPGEP